MNSFTPNVKRVSKVDVKSTLKLGATLAKQKRFDEAAQQFEEALQADPNSIKALIALGNIAYRQGQYDESLSYYQRAIRLDPMKTAPQLRAGRILLKQDQPIKALEHFLNVIRIDPKTTLAYAGAGQAYFQEKNYDEAVQQLQLALRLNPQMVAVRQHIALIYTNQGKHDKALTELQTALRTKPNSPHLHLTIGQIYLLKGDFAAARGAFEQAIELNDEPSDKALLGLAEALLGSGRHNEAAEVLQSMPQRPQITARHHKLWGDIYTAKGLFKEAAESYQAVTLAEADEQDISLSDDLLSMQEDADWEDVASTRRQSAKAILENRRAKFQAK